MYRSYASKRSERYTRRPLLTSSRYGFEPYQTLIRPTLITPNNATPDLVDLSNCILDDRVEVERVSAVDTLRSTVTGSSAGGVHRTSMSGVKSFANFVFKVW